eukprot:3788039-Rhodomonas_salina.1
MEEKKKRCGEEEQFTVEGEKEEGETSRCQRSKSARRRLPSLGREGRNRRALRCPRSKSARDEMVKGREKEEM